MAAAAEAKLNPAPLAHAAALAERAGAVAEALAARAQPERIEAEIVQRVSLTHSFTVRVIHIKF